MPQDKKLNNQKSLNPIVVALLGPPGSGKGTQSKLLADKFSLEYFGGGAALRERRKTKDFTGKKLYGVMKRGDLAPTFLIAELWMEKLEEFKNKSLDPGQDFDGFVCDGTPRKLMEAKLFDQALKWYGWEEQAKVFLIKISEKEAYDRLTKRRVCQKCERIIPWVGEFKKLEKCDRCGGKLITRPDDTPEGIGQRLEEYREEVLRVVEHYRNKGKLIEIDGEKGIQEVFDQIISHLNY